MNFFDLETGQQEELLQELYDAGRAFLEGWNMGTDAKEDILQSSMLRAAEKLDTLRNPEKMHAWIRTIVSNEAKYYLKSRKREADMWYQISGLREFRQWRISGDIFSREAYTEMEGMADREESLCLLCGLISRLGNPTGTILLRMALYDESLEEIGNRLQMKPATVRSHVFRARSRLKKMILENRNLEEAYGWYLKRQQT